MKKFHFNVYVPVKEGQEQGEVALALEKSVPPGSEVFYVETFDDESE